MRIKSIRKQLNMSQVELADKSGITQAYLSALENGVKRNPSLKTLGSIANALDVQVTELIYDFEGQKDAS